MVGGAFRFRVVRYLASSGISFAAGIAILELCFIVLRWSAVLANISAYVGGGAVSYVLYRRWTFLRQGNSSLTREVIPYFLLTMMNLGLSTLFAQVASQLAEGFTSDRTAIGGAVLGGVALGNALAIPLKYLACRWIFTQLANGGAPSEHEATVTAV